MSRDVPHLLREVGADRIMFPADYPFPSRAGARAVPDRQPHAVSPADLLEPLLIGRRTREHTLSLAAGGRS